MLRYATKSIPKKAVRKKAAPTVRRTRATLSTTAKKRIALARRIAALAASPTSERIKFARAHRIVALVALLRRVAPLPALHRRVVTGMRSISASVAQGLPLARVARGRAQEAVAREDRRRPTRRSISLNKSDAWSIRCSSSGSICSAGSALRSHRTVSDQMVSSWVS